MVSSHRYLTMGWTYTIHVNFFPNEEQKKIVDIRANEFWEGHMGWGIKYNLLWETSLVVQWLRIHLEM